MKKIWKVVAGATLGVAVSSLAWVGLAQAQTFTATVEPNQTVDSSVYSADQTVSISGTINGDVYCAGQNVMIDATVNGDVLCGGQTVTVKGKVKGSVRVAGQTVTVDAQIGHAATLLGDAITVSKDTTIGQDITITGNTANIDGKIGRDVVIAGSQATIYGTVDRNVRFDGGQIDVKGNGKIDGGLYYTSAQNAGVTQSQVGGTIDHNMPKQEKPSKAMFFGVGAKIFLFFLIAVLIFALVLVLIFPQAIHRVSGIAVGSLGKTILVGFLATLIFPIAIIGLGISLIGIPLAIFLLLAWLLISMLSLPIMGYYLGSMVLAKSKRPVLIMLVGVTLLCVLFYLPIVGFIVMLVSHWIGSGAILLSLKTRTPKPAYKIQ